MTRFIKFDPSYTALHDSEQIPTGDAFRKFRKARGFTGRDLAGLCGLSQGHISDIESGNRRITATVLEKIATGLGVDVGSITKEISKHGELFNLRDDVTEYRFQNQKSSNLPFSAPVDDFRILSEWFVSQIPKSEAWDLVRKLADLAEKGDLAAAKRAKALIDILST